jgi:hypothetical protein
MRQPRLFSALFVFLFVVGLSLCAPKAEAAPIFSVLPSASNLNVGDTFSVDIGINDIVDLYAYQFSISFNPAIVAVNAVSEGSMLGFFGSTIFFPGVVDNVGGSVTFVANALAGAVSGAVGSGYLATLQFTAVGAGLSSITAFLDAANGDAFLDSALNEITGIAPLSADVTVAASTPDPIPEPTSMLLLGSGLAGAWYRHRRKRAA